MPVTLTDIQQAAERIRPFVHRTPVLTNESLNQRVGAQVFLKCETMQKVGASVYEQPGQTPPEGEGPAERGPQGGEEGTVEGEFREV